MATFRVRPRSNLHFLTHRLTNSLIFLIVCMAKTQYSFSHDPKLKGVPSGRSCPFSPRSWWHIKLTHFWADLRFRLYDSDPICSTVGRRRVLISHSWRHADDARVGYTSRYAFIQSMTGLCQLTSNVQASGKSAWILTLAVLLGCSKSTSLCVSYFFWIAASLAPLFSTTPVFSYFNSLLRTLNKHTFLHGHAIL